MRLIIERIEEGIAVCEVLGKPSLEPSSAGAVIRRGFQTYELPDGAKEGDVLIFENDKLTQDRKASRERRERIQKLMNEVFD